MEKKKSLSNPKRQLNSITHLPTRPTMKTRRQEVKKKKEEHKEDDKHDNESEDARDDDSFTPSGGLTD